MTKRISAADAKERIQAGFSLLICIYDDEKFNSQAHLEGAIPMSEFLKIKPDLAMDTEIIFYWGWADDTSAAGLAVEYTDKGYTRMKVLDKGISGWKAAGFNML